MSDYFDRIERQLVERVGAGLPRRSRFPGRLDYLPVATSLLVVIVVGAVFVAIRGSSPTGSSVGSRTIRIVFSASPLDPRVPLDPSIGHSVEILRRRLDSVFRGAQVARAGNRVVVVVPIGAGVGRGRIVALAVPARLEFYDWEANALTPDGNTVASQLPNQDPVAVEISQGSASAAPGAPGAGSLSLYAAVELASKQAPLTTLDSSRLGPQYYLFGAPRSTACQTAARDHGVPAVASVHCLLSGPDSTPKALDSELPAGVSASQGQRLKVPRGTVVLQAADITAANPTPLSSPAAQFYVLKDHAALPGADITHPKQSTDQTGTPDVNFAFNSAGASRFQNITAQIAKRGLLVSGPHQSLNQHFAVALDNHLITVPSIDYKTYSDGIAGGGGADITGGFTIQSARNLAMLLRSGPLTVNLEAR